MSKWSYIFAQDCYFHNHIFAAESSLLIREFPNLQNTFLPSLLIHINEFLIREFFLGPINREVGGTTAAQWSDGVTKPLRLSLILKILWTFECFWI